MTDPLNTPSPISTDPAELSAAIEKLRLELEDVKARRSGEASKFALERQAFEKELAVLREQVVTTPQRIAEALGMTQPPEDPLNAVNQRLNDLAQQLESEKRSRQAAERLAAETTRNLRKTQLLPPELASFAEYVPTLEDEAAQKQAIALFSERLTAFQKNAKAPPPPPVPGTPPSAPPGNGSTTDLATLQKRYMQAITDRDQEAITRIGNEYYDALSLQPR